MVEYLNNFWTFFFYPILQHESLTIFPVIALCLIIGVLFRFVREVWQCF